MPEKLELLTRRFRLSPVGPDKVSENWLGWTRDSFLMAQLNMRPGKLSLVQIQQHVAAAWKGGKAVFGIYLRSHGDHVGLYEVALDRRNANATLDMLIDQHRYDLGDVLSETDPAILSFLAGSHGVEKAVVQLVETYEPAIRYYETANWRREGVLRQERQAVTGGHRLDVVQFGCLLVPA